MGVCMYICMYVSMYVYAYSRHMHVYVCMPLSMCVYTHRGLLNFYEDFHFLKIHKFNGSFLIVCKAKEKILNNGLA